MDIPYLKNEFKNSQSFLEKLYKNNPRRNSKIIEKADDKELKVLIKILHLICTGQISIRGQDFKTLQKSKRLNYFKLHFESIKSFLDLLKSNRQHKVNVLKKFSALYEQLLFTMFNKI